MPSKLNPDWLTDAFNKAFIQNYKHFELRSVPDIEQHLYSTTDYQYVIMNTDVFANEIRLRRVSLFGTNFMKIPMSVLNFIAAYNFWQEGELIQNAFPKLDANQREFIMTGCLPEQWENLFDEENQKEKTL